MSNDIPTRVRELVRARDGGRCVRCRMPATNQHHRRRKRVNYDGLAHSPANIVTLCGMGNVTGCHGWAHKNPAAAHDVGLILWPEESPLEVPFQHVRLGQIRLSPDGSVSAVEG